MPLACRLYAMTLLTEALILGLFAMSLDLMVGYARLISFGHAAAYGLGAYACGNLLLHTSIPLVFAVLLAALFSGIVAIGVGWVCTLAIRRFVLHADPGFRATALRRRLQMDRRHRRLRRPRGHPAQPRPVRRHFFAGHAPASTIWCSAAWSAAFIFCRALVRSPFGAVLRGIRENEAKTLSLGYNTRRYKIAVVAISFVLGGLAGALYAPFAGFANTELLFWLFSGQVLIMVIVGGAGTLVGPIIGAAFFMLVSNLLSSWTNSWALFFGADLHPVRAVRAAGHLGLAALTAATGDAPMALLELDGLTRRFGGIVAVDRRDDARRGRRGPRGHRTQRRRQIHAVQPDHRRRETDRAARCASTTQTLTGLSAYSVASAACHARSRSPRCSPR